MNHPKVNKTHQENVKIPLQISKLGEAFSVFKLHNTLLILLIDISNKYGI